MALLDILGFRARMETEEPQQLFAETLGELPAIISTSSDLAPKINAAQFSDTIFLWATVGAEREQGARSQPFDCVEAICIAAFGLMHRCARRGFYLRGAIAFGDCFISRSPPAFVGKPIVAAAKLERRQQWSGVALDASAEEILGYDGLWSPGLRPFVRYLVPMKEPPDEIRVVIKWSRVDGTGLICPSGRRGEARGRRRRERGDPPPPMPPPRSQPSPRQLQELPFHVRSASAQISVGVRVVEKSLNSSRLPMRFSPPYCPFPNHSGMVLMLMAPPPTDADPI